MQQESAMKSLGREGQERSKASFDRKGTFSMSEKEWMVGSRESTSNGKPEKNIPTTVTIISKHTPKSDVEKSYKWVPNQSDMTGIRSKARITEMNNLKIFLDKIASPPKNVQGKSGILKGGAAKDNKKDNSYSMSSE